MLNKKLLNILVCSKCKQKIKQKNMFLICNKCKLAYPILDKDIPNMLITDAWSLNKAKKAIYKHHLKLE